MKNFFEDYILYILIFVLVLVIVLAVVVSANDNDQVVITNDAHFTWAIIQLGNGELIEGCVKQWNTYSNAHMIQITLNNNLTIMTDIENVLLCSHEP